MLDKKLMKSALNEIAVLRTELARVHKKTDTGHLRRKSLLNLMQYLMLRSKDRTKLQEKLFMTSLSSLGRSYAHVEVSIDILYKQLICSLHPEKACEKELGSSIDLSIHEAFAIASQNSKALFGGKTSNRLSKQSTAVMVTLPSHAAENKGHLIHDLADAGVNAFRINTAHDSSNTWQAMADVIIDINKTRKPDDKIMIFIDLSGPKIRTGKIRRLTQPIVIGSNKLEKEVLICLNNMHTKSKTIDAVTLKEVPAQIVVNKKFFNQIKKDQLIKIVDVNGKKRFITILEVTDHYAKGLINKKAYIDKDTKLSNKHHEGNVLHVEQQIDRIRLFVNDLLLITGENLRGRPAVKDKQGNIVKPALISCSFQGIVSYISVGDKIFIDDGKIGLEVIECSPESITCRVTHAKVKGTLLKEEKGINFPDTYIKTSALTGIDCKNILTVLKYADHLSLSFCQNAEDVRKLQHLLVKADRRDIGIVAKIETRQAVINMPEILTQLLVWEKSGVMIARGDLAIEVGFKNMAYTQETLLDICDAAHMPVIWATQVLESQMKNNIPSRAELTDAAMASRAECVMLNKGAFATDTIGTLRYILNDMHAMFKKNRQLLKRGAYW